MPIPAPVNYQIVPIRHSNSYYRTPTKSLQNLNSFVAYRGSVDDNNNDSNSRYGTLRTAEERRSPYYYNELNRTNLQQFSPITSRIHSPNHFDNVPNDESLIDFINTINAAETVSWALLLSQFIVDTCLAGSFINYVTLLISTWSIIRWQYINWANIFLKCMWHNSWTVPEYLLEKLQFHACFSLLQIALLDELSTDWHLTSPANVIYQLGRIRWLRNHQCSFSVLRFILQSTTTVTKNLTDIFITNHCVFPFFYFYVSVICLINRHLLIINGTFISPSSCVVFCLLIFMKFSVHFHPQKSPHTPRKIGLTN